MAQDYNPSMQEAEAEGSIKNKSWKKLTKANKFSSNACRDNLSSEISSVFMKWFNIKNLDLWNKIIF